MGRKESLNITDLMARLKMVKGENFITIENTTSLTNPELIELIPCIMEKPFIKSCKNVNILVDSEINQEVVSLLTDYEFTLHDENVTVHKVLDESSTIEYGFSLKSLYDLSIPEFKRIWEASMKESLNVLSSLNIDEHMRSVEVELGPTYKKSCMVAYENEVPIGVLMPHIEPGTSDEGRIFYFGIIPSERGKGKSKLLHQQALEILKKDFKASYYIGSTGHNNLPMLRTFRHNVCTVIE
ncbi:GNAT family N-acetyltransferase [Rossellomorea sp. AcN35-11]|nr:GNAT family N-acetyltransferase [Rossellomorea aquimaris]WJV31416.1 GNAT family N-acetyltransferase [Rossellomorea sp. AcN35-11]